ncbi:MAG TPA: right-handed parallel beta-helix repeat-containing protein [bacterium]|nr:right-handed parallel beta-helix repeat-containing protein [bacterium]
MRALTWTLLLTLLCGCASANTIVVDPGGGGNFDNIPEAMFRGTADDTVLVMPGYYEVEEGIPYPWPVPLTSDSPSLVSHGGAETTLILGDGSLPAFVVTESRYGARILISGFKFMALETPFDWDGPGYGAEVSFTDNIVEECEIGVDIRWGSGTVARNVITGPGWYGIQCPYFSGSIEDNEISGFLVDGIISTNEDTEILRNHIHDNANAGITTTADCIAEGNLIENNGWYGLSVAFDAHLTDNVIRGNGVGIEYWGGPHTGFMHGNEIYDNVDASVSAYAGDLDPPTLFDATMNWWGTTDPVAISESIWDCHDSEWAGVCFIFDPWCLTPTCDPTGFADHTTWGAIKAMHR